MNRIVFIYIRAFFVMLICAAMLFCLCGCTVNDNNPNNVNNDIVEVPKPTPHPTPTFVPTVEPSPTPGADGCRHARSHGRDNAGRNG